MHKKKYNKRIIPAYHFRAQYLGDEEIEIYVNDILQSIEDDIRYAVENEEHHTQTQLSTLFSVTGMDNVRAQRHIYFHVLKALEQNGYIPHIEFKSALSQVQVVYIRTTWITKEDRETEKLMDKFIAHHQVGKRKMDEDHTPNTGLIHRRRRRRATEKTK